MRADLRHRGGGPICFPARQQRGKYRGLRTHVCASFGNHQFDTKLTSFEPMQYPPPPPLDLRGDFREVHPMITAGVPRRWRAGDLQRN